MRFKPRAGEPSILTCVPCTVAACPYSFQTQSGRTKHSDVARPGSSVAAVRGFKPRAGEPSILTLAPESVRTILDVGFQTQSGQNKHSDGGHSAAASHHSRFQTQSGRTKHSDVARPGSSVAAVRGFKPRAGEPSILTLAPESVRTILDVGFQTQSGQNKHSDYIINGMEIPNSLVSNPERAKQAF